MNGLALRNPTRMGFSDSYPLGLGGFTHGGRAWRLKLNPSLVAHGKDVSNNVLEFLGMAITLWLSLIECEELGLVNELLLILGDNTSAISWIIKVISSQVISIQTCCSFHRTKDSVDSLQVTKLYRSTSPPWKIQLNCQLVIFRGTRTL